MIIRGNAPVPSLRAIEPTPEPAKPVLEIARPAKSQPPNQELIDIGAHYLMLWEEMKDEIGREFEDAGKVVIASLCCGAKPSCIKALTDLSALRIKRYGATLYDNGVWHGDGRISMEFDEDNHMLAMVGIMMQVLCAQGLVVTDKWENWRNGHCQDCSGPKSIGAGRRCRECYRARSRILNS